MQRWMRAAPVIALALAGCSGSSSINDSGDANLSSEAAQMEAAANSRANAMAGDMMQQAANAAAADTAGNNAADAADGDGTGNN